MEKDNKITLTEYVCIDMQGTGPHNRETEEIFEVGAVVIKKGKIAKTVFHKRYKTKGEIPSFITKVHGASSQHTNDYMEKEEQGELINFIGNRVIVVHNPYPERRLLGKIENNNKRILILDTLKFAKNIFPNLESYSLASLVKHLSIEFTEINNSLHEATATANIFLKLMDRLPDDKQNVDYMSKICAHEIIKEKLL